MNNLTKSALAFFLIHPLMVNASTQALSDASSSIHLDNQSDYLLSQIAFQQSQQLQHHDMYFRIGNMPQEVGFETIQWSAYENYYDLTSRSWGKKTTGNLSIDLGHSILPMFNVELSYLLDSEVDTTTITENIKITNISGLGLNVDLFKYIDFDLGGAIGDNADFANNQFVQTNGGIVVTHDSDQTLSSHQIGGASIGQFGLNSSSIALTPSSAPIDDIALAMSWNLSLDLDEAWLATNTIQLSPAAPVPVPASWLLIASGLLLLRRFKS